MIITIDGKECSCKQGELLLHVARRNNIFIPSLCFHEGLGGLGACRVCIVEVLDRERSSIVVSCIYPIEHEIEVFTASDKVKEQRGVILTLLARLAPGAKVIQQMAAANGADIPRLISKPDGDTCILCGRCTTACNLVGSGAIAKVNRGTTKAIDTPYDKPSSECIGCASCAHVCPTNTIPFTETERTVAIWGRTFDLQTCELCGAVISTDELIAQAIHAIGHKGVQEAARAAVAAAGTADVPETATANAAETTGVAVCAECRKKATADRLRQGFKL